MTATQAFRCDACGAEFATREQLEAHVQQAHPGMQAQPQGSFRCDACGATFGTREELQAHAQSEHGR